jgi:Domain of unknown function (DUF4149)
MKTLLRTLLYLALIVWLGAEIFFPVIATTTFGVLHADTHTAGTIVGSLLRTLHGIGFVSGIVLLALLAVAPAWHIFKSRSVFAPMILLVLMLAATAYSQFVIIPAMEHDRISAGGSIDLAEPTNPAVVDFNRLHNRSEHVEGFIVLLGLATVVLIAYAESSRA